MKRMALSVCRMTLKNRVSKIKVITKEDDPLLDIWHQPGGN